MSRDHGGWPQIQLVGLADQRQLHQVHHEAERWGDDVSAGEVHPGEER